MDDIERLLQKHREETTLKNRVCALLDEFKYQQAIDTIAKAFRESRPLDDPEEDNRTPGLLEEEY